MNDYCETRAALDIGSAQTKILVADVNRHSNKIVKIHHKSHRFVFLKKDLASSADGTLSIKIQESLIQALKELKDSTKIFNPKKWRAAATSVFRLASNTCELVEKIEEATGIKIQVISQTDEAEIGFRSAIEASQQIPEKIISLDTGSGSFQISCFIDNQFYMYGNETGSSAIFETLFRMRNNQIFPISFQEIRSLIGVIREQLPIVPEWLTSTDKKIIAIGNGDFFPQTWLAKKKLVITKLDLLHILFDITNKQADNICQFDNPQDALILILHYALMEQCNIKKIYYHRTTGGCEGLLTASKYWN